MRKSIILATKSPYLNCEVAPESLVTFKERFSKLAGKNRPTVGLIISFTSAVTNLDAAAPMTNAIANPIIPKVLRKSKNSWMNDFDSGDGDSVKLVKYRLLHYLNAPLEFSSVLFQTWISYELAK